MDFGAINWMMITGVGVAILLVVIAVAALRNRVSPEQAERTERATHDLYEEEDRAHPGSGSGSV